MAEMTLERLPPAEQFALWALRVWVAAHRRPVNLLPMLRDGFAAAGMPQAWFELDRWMSLFLDAARRPVEIQSIRYPSLGDDEIGLLSWMAAAQRKDIPPAQSAQARATLSSAEQLAAHFDSAGLLFAGDMALGCRGADEPH
jgi:hypothetical protein